GWGAGSGGGAAWGGRLCELAARRDPELDGALRAFLAQIEDDDPLETALRLWNLAVVVSLVGPRALSDEAAAELAAALVISARNVEIQLEDRGLAIGSHLVGELVALHACGVLLGAAGGETGAWRARARAALAREARVQVLPDGGGAEGSTGYARFVAELWIAALCCGRAGGEQPSPAVSEAARRMLVHLVETMAPDGDGLGIGDDDASIVLPRATDTAALAPLLALLPLGRLPAGRG